MSLPLALKQPASHAPVLMESSPDVIPKILSCGRRITWLRFPSISRPPPNVYESVPPLPENAILCGVPFSGNVTGPALAADANKQSVSSATTSSKRRFACLSIISPLPHKQRKRTENKAVAVPISYRVCADSKSLIGSLLQEKGLIW